MMLLAPAPAPAALLPKIERMFALSAGKIRSLDETLASVGRRAGVHRGRPLSRAGLDASGRKAFSSARHSCSSTRPATPRSSSAAGRRPSSAWRRT